MVILLCGWYRWRVIDLDLGLRDRVEVREGRVVVGFGVVGKEGGVSGVG